MFVTQMLLVKKFENFGFTPKKVPSLPRTPDSKSGVIVTQLQWASIS